jgi:CheY-like chemotaxis protein
MGKKKKLNILIVDDDKGVRETFRLLFELEGYKVSTATNARETIEKVKQESIDLALIDYQLPEITGLQISQKIREFNKQIKIFIITGNVEFEEIKTQTFEMKGQACFKKPPDTNKLIKAVKNAIDN